MNVIAEAQALGRRGFRVFPVRPDTKKPRITGWQQAATSDPDAIGYLFAPFPNASIGIRTGDGLVVVDDDRRGGLETSLLPTLVATTPKGGHHYYFTCPTPIRNSASKIAPGVDVRAEGGYVVAPPSEGREWLGTLRHEPKPLPGILLAACLRNEPRGGDFEPRSHVPAGERHDYLVRFAGWALANEIDTEGPFDAFVLEHAFQVCEPWPKSELGGVARHVADLCRWVIARETGRS